MEIHAYPGPENLTVLFRDVTERHRMVQALEEAHAAGGLAGHGSPRRTPIRWCAHRRKVRPFTAIRRPLKTGSGCATSVNLSLIRSEH